MMFLIKTTFWLSLVLLLLPIDRHAAGIAEGPGTLETFSAVRTVVSDARGFCDRNPSACATGTATLAVLRQKAVYSAGIIQTWLAQDSNVRATEVIPAYQDNDARGRIPETASADQVAALIQAADARLAAQSHPPL
ncbi:MAG: DUF5330 domain-containing protein [Devosiaceae bacterium]